MTGTKIKVVPVGKNEDTDIERKDRKGIKKRRVEEDSVYGKTFNSRRRVSVVI